MATQKLIQFASSLNIAELLEEEELDEVAAIVLENYNEDKSSLTKWIKRAKETIKMAGMEGLGANDDSDNTEGSNVKSPIVARACITFAANVLPEFIKDDKVCKAKIYGDDPQGIKIEKAKNAMGYMNFETLGPASDWQESFDKTLTQLSCTGQAFRKALWDPKRKESKTIFLNYDEVFLNNKAKSIEDARSITHVQPYHKNDLISLHRKGIFSEPPKSATDEEHREIVSGRVERAGFYTILEQHCWLDLDDDGYEEPYIVFLHETSKTVLRIVARYTMQDIEYTKQDDKEVEPEVISIEPEIYFIPYICLPSFDGTFFGIGLGTLLTSITASFDTSMNQIIDAGRLANEGITFMDKSLNYKTKDLKLKSGQINIVDFGGGNIEQHIKRFDFKEPSPTLFSMLGFLDSFAKELSTTTDAMTGADMPSNMKTGAANLMVERGMKMYNSILKRIFKSLTLELNIRFKLLHRYLDQAKYAMVMDNQQASVKKDFDLSSFDIFPIADPNLASDTARAGMAQALLELKDDPNLPVPNKFAMMSEYLLSIGYTNVQRFIPDASKAQEDPEIAQMKQQMEEQQQQLQQQQMSHDLEQAKLSITAQKNQTDAQIKVAALDQKEKDSQRKQLKDLIEIQTNAELKNKEINVKKQSTKSSD